MARRLKTHLKHAILLDLLLSKDICRAVCWARRASRVAGQRRIDRTCRSPNAWARSCVFPVFPRDSVVVHGVERGARGGVIALHYRISGTARTHFRVFYYRTTLQLTDVDIDDAVVDVQDDVVVPNEDSIHLHAPIDDPLAEI